MEQKTTDYDEVIALNNITLERENRRILDGVSWTVRSGEHWVLYGPNGAGKTTLLNILCGYLWPTEGEVCVLRHRFGAVDLTQLRRRIAFVSEPLMRMIRPDLVGAEVLITGARAHLNLFDPPTSAELRHVVQTAVETHTQDLLEKPFGAMSTGERQRLLIARALMRKPEIVILDEPCAGLDLAGREFVLHTLELVSQRPSAPTLVLTTHHVEEITEIFTHALLLRAGRVLAAGPIRTTLCSRRLSELFDLPIRVMYRHGRWTAILDRDGVS
ncbi:MAG: ABC transporter ATP-binding protein [Candidatus Sumerlaeaceae bacterium]